MENFGVKAELEGIRKLLSHLTGEVATLERSYSEVLHVLKQVEWACNRDDLTGCLRRQSFFERWEQLLERCQKIGQTCGLLLIDIDHFKKINDTHGHPTGDEVLRKVGALIRQFESETTFVSRYGGEEFAVALMGTDAEMLATAEFIRRGAERLHGPVIGPDGEPNPGVEWKCTLSIGMASTRALDTGGQAKEGSADAHAESLLRKADQALYEAKNRGRNQVRAA